MAPRRRLSDSESESDELSTTIPSDRVLERGLRDQVAAIFSNGNMQDLTVKRVRLATEKKLGVEEGFFKTTGDWKERSDKIIKDEVEEQERRPKEKEAQIAENPPSSPPQPKKAAPKRSKDESEPKPRKRQKTQTPVSEDVSEDEVSDELDSEREHEIAKPKKRKTAEKKGPKSQSAKSPSEASDVPDEKRDDAKPTVEAASDDSESEMSVVQDDEPKPPARKRSKSTETAGKKEKRKAAPKGKGKDEDQDPDQAEIKKLQGLLVKCGIRKMWWRELQPYETPKAKIKHLKQMLEDAGMKGRYSLDKAKAIRDERELKEDLEMIQQGAKHWGTGEDDGSDQPPPPRAARGRQALAFLEDEDEDAESD